MDKLAELKEKLKELSPEELEAFKTFITANETKAESEETAETEAPDTAVVTKEEEKVEEQITEEKAEENTEAETAPSEETPEAEEKPAEAAETTATEEVPTEEEKGENEGTEEAVTEPEPETQEDDDIPVMTKGAPAGEVDTVDEGSITAETGETLPIDYEQIIEGLNAKVAALEAENASLKNKVNGAFGYSAKPTTPAKVNRLYDDCADVHFHR